MQSSRFFESFLVTNSRFSQDMAQIHHNSDAANYEINVNKA